MKNRIIAIVICILSLGAFLIFYEGTTKNNHEEEPSTTQVLKATQYNKKATKKTKKKKSMKKKTTKKKSTKKKRKKSCYSMSVKASKSTIINYAHEQVVARWGEGHWEALYKLIQRESGWNANSVNRSSCACGLFQFYPCSKGGKSYRTSYEAQITQGLDYIQGRYGSPKKAWKFWQKHHWY